MSETPAWALTAMYWLHMLATVAWIGGLAAVVFLFLPAARQLAGPEDQARFLQGVFRRFDPLAWLSLVVLVGTGMFQMSASPQYEGFLAVENRWALAILIKHLVFFGMTGISAYLTWSVLPAIRTALLLASRGKPAPTLPTLHRRSLGLLWVNLVLGIIVLAFTALARASV